jgi:hypothetical protein
MKATAWAALCLVSGVFGLPQITRTGKYLYDPNGTRFSIKVRRGSGR